MRLINLFKNLFSIFYPKLCVGCLDALIEGENFFCLNCILELPKTSYHFNNDNLAYDRLGGKIPIVKAASFLYYNKGGLGQKLVAEIKYQGNIYLGKWIGEYMANEMLSSGFFQNMDFIVPVPLHKKKFRKRGFNQSEVIAQGISNVSTVPMETKNLYRKKANVSQTRKGMYERWKNTQGIFDLKEIKLFDDKHILLVDDVLTTGATLEACAEALLKCKNVKISIFTLAIA
ncbi:MAG: ComF family protein [Dysgonamonadaceae bacterium]|jgi:ComF family protein|nr:ComF family protein [Dysgonamonadaceae bacterium]